MHARPTNDSRPALRGFLLRLGAALLVACSDGSTTTGDPNASGADASSSNADARADDGSASSGDASVGGAKDSGATFAPDASSDPGSCCTRSATYDNTCSAAASRAFQCFCPGGAGIPAACKVHQGTLIVCCP